MTTVEAGPRKLDLGRVFGDTFGVVRRQATPLIGVSFVLAYLPTLVSGYLSVYVFRTATPTPGAPFAVFSQPAATVVTLVVGLFALLALAFQLEVAISDLDGRRTPVAETLRAALGKVLPILGASLLVGLGVMLGLVFLIVPGVILGVMWIVALPVVTADGANPVRALGRSRILTRGNRWRIFGLSLLVWLVLIICEGLFFGVAAALGAVGAAGLGIFGLALSSLISFAFSLLVSVGTAALYVQLRELKGAGAESLAQVFA